MTNVIFYTMDNLICSFEKLQINKYDFERQHIFDLIIKLSDNYQKIIDRKTIKKYKIIDWGNNGIGDRFARKIFNYTVIYSNKTYKTYSEKDENIDSEHLSNFLQSVKSKKPNGIVGILIHSERMNAVSRPIRKDIKDIILNNPCVSCGSNNDIVCDHKNDLYNDQRVLNIKTQRLEDFQPLCNHCNLQKRQICKEERTIKKLYSGKNIPHLRIYNFIFPWELKKYDEKNPLLKIDTYWYDPVHFVCLVRNYEKWIPILEEIKKYDRDDDNDIFTLSSSFYDQFLPC